MKDDTTELYIKIFDLKQKPTRRGQDKFFKACMGLCEKFGMSPNDASDFVTKTFTTYEEYIFVKDEVKNEVNETILNWAITSFSPNCIWALSYLEYYPESKQWEFLHKHLSKEQKDVIAKEIVNAVRKLEENDKEEESFIVNTKSLTGMNGAYIPKSTWDYHFPIRFCYEHTNRNEMSLHRGLTAAVAQILSLLPLLSEQQAFSLLKTTSHPLIELYLSNKLVEFRRRQGLKIINFISESSHVLLTSIAILKTFDEVQKIKHEIEARNSNEPYHLNKMYEGLSVKALEEKASKQKSELIQNIEKLDPEKSIILASEIIANCEFIFHARPNTRDEESIEIENEYPKLIANQLLKSESFNLEEIKRHLLSGARDSKLRFLWHIGSHLSKENPKRKELLYSLLNAYSENIQNLESHKFHSFFHDWDFIEHINDMGRVIFELDEANNFNSVEFYNNLFEKLPVSIWDFEEDYALFLEGIRHFFHLAIVFSIASEKIRDGNLLIHRIREDFLGIWEFYGDSSFVDEVYPDLLIKNIYFLTQRNSEQEAESFLVQILKYDYVPKTALKTIIENEKIQGEVLKVSLGTLINKFEFDLSRNNTNALIWWKDAWKELNLVDNEYLAAKAIYESNKSHHFEGDHTYLETYTRYLENNPSEIEPARDQLQSIYTKTFPRYLQSEEVTKAKQNIKEKLEIMGIHLRG
jgi:hypothetical protein